MARRKEESVCESVRDYCFDLLFPELAGEVPREVRLHAASCGKCRERLADVKQLLGVLGGPRLQQHLFTRELTRHFRLLGANVGCGDVRQFLPLLADESLEMKIPTPVTVHCDQCRQCGHDVRTIESLMLKPEQLARLGGLFSHKYKAEAGDCAKFANSVRILASLRFDKVEAEAARHIGACKKCRAALYEERLRLKLQNGDGEISRIPCGAIKPADMFDFTIPFGLDLHRHQYAKFKGVLADHLRQCPTCLERMRQLHNIIYTIDSRGDSGVVTVYQFAPGKRQKAMTNVSEQYPTWPIKVHAAGPGFEKKPKPPLVSRLTQKLAQNASKLKLKQLAKLTATAAVFTVLAAVLIVKMPAAGGVTLSDLYSAFDRRSNVYVRSMAADGETVIQETWASEKHGWFLLASDNRFTLWDLRSGSATFNTPENPVPRVTPVANEVIQRIKDRLSHYGDIMPFPDESKIPKPWTWNQISDPNLESRLPGTVVYELTWKRPGVLRRWRGFIDVHTSLPQLSETYEKGRWDKELVLKTVIRFEYPSDDEFMAAIEAVKVEPESGAAGVPPSIPALSP